MNTLTRVVLWGLLFCFPAGANAQQGQHLQKSLELGVGLICNSAEQVERYIALQTAQEPPDAAIRLVNDEAQDPNACAVAAVAFVRGDKGKSVQAPGGMMHITPVMILATQTAAGWQRVPPIVQFTAIFEKLEEA